jgi:hypothetical protein
MGFTLGLCTAAPYNSGPAVVFKLVTGAINVLAATRLLLEALLCISKASIGRLMWNTLNVFGGKYQ